MEQEFTYWAVIDPATNLVILVNICQGDGRAAMQSTYPDNVIAECALSGNSAAGPGYLYDEPTGWFISPHPEDEDPEIYFDRESWRWVFPNAVDTGSPDSLES